jgi:hypothetical protein
MIDEFVAHEISDSIMLLFIYPMTQQLIEIVSSINRLIV